VGEFVVNAGDKFQITTITPLTQMTAKICWGTSYAMMYQWKGKKNEPEALKALRDVMKTNDAFRAYLQKYKDDHPDLKPPVDVVAEMDIWTYGMANGLQIEQMIFAGTALSLMGYRKVTLDDEDRFLDVLKRYGPMWCAGHFLDPDGLHAVVAVGIEKVGINAIVSLIDPYGPFISTEPSATYTRGHKDFVRKIVAEPFAVQIWP
jgi:hypothetical protein